MFTSVAAEAVGWLEGMDELNEWINYYFWLFLGQMA